VRKILIEFEKDDNMGKKQTVIEDIFRICRKRDNFVFDNSLVKEVCRKHAFGNPFDATKLDDTSKFPEILLDEDYFILHLGKGYHQFVKGIDIGFHKFEKIPPESINDWKYRKSILNELDESESNILSIITNQRIIHDFLYEDITVNPKVYYPRRTKTSLEYRVYDTTIKTTNIQMEIDLTMEHNGYVTIFEAKNNFPENFAVYQLYHPFLYFVRLKNAKQLPINEITCCYLLRKFVEKQSVIRIYNYTFDGECDMASIRLLRCAQYNLIQR